MVKMFGDCENYNMLKKMLVSSRPQNIAIKYRMEDGVLLAINNNFSLFFLNSVAGEFLMLCNGKNTFGEICSQFVNDYDVNENIIVDDLMTVIRDLQKKSLLYIDPLEVLD